MAQLLSTGLMLVFGVTALMAYGTCATAGRADEAAGWKDAP